MTRSSTTATLSLRWRRQASTSPRRRFGLIDVEYEVLKPVLDVREAMADDAPILLSGCAPSPWGKSGDKADQI